MDDLVIQSIVKLKESELVSYEGEAPAIGRLQSTEYGDIMSKVGSVARGVPDR